MPTSYLPYVPDQQLLLPHSLQEWLPKGIWPITSTTPSTRWI